MSVKQRFFTHEAAYMGKKVNYLPMTGNACTQKANFLCVLTGKVCLI